MNIEITLDKSLTKRLTLTPKLQQAIRVLRMPLLELNQFITQKLQQNPLLEADESKTGEVESEVLKDDKRSSLRVIPDVAIKKVNGEYRVLFNDDGMPRLRLNPHYMKILTGQHREVVDESKKSLERQHSLAIDLISSINQRRKTIVRVTKAIFEIQAGFLEHGTPGLKPLKLKQIAEIAKVHESTASRVASDKYVETPQGIFELKYFFAPGLPTDSGEYVSSTTVKDKIKKMIDAENAAQPLSDQGISNALGNQGIQVARRTVQKYREELNILVSRKRKTKDSRTTNPVQEHVRSDRVPHKGITHLSQVDNPTNSNELA